MFSLKDKVAIISGATKGLGLGIAKAYAASGANVVVVSRNQGQCAQVAEELQETYKVKTLAHATDVTSMEQIESLAAKAEAAFGRVDILVNNAGSGIGKNAEDITEADWDHIINVDLKSVFFCSQIIGRQMIKQKSGKIINIASILSLVGDRSVLPYCVAKGGVLQLTKALALEWVRYNIQVNAICPGYFATEINEEAFRDERVKNAILRKIPAGHFGNIAEVGAAAVYLGSSAANYMTGQHIVIDGGYVAQ